MMLTRIVLSLVAFALVLQPAKAADPLGADAQEFIKSHCIKCHDARKQKGKFRLDNLSADFTDPQVAEKWNEVVFRINAAEMPPEDEPQPSAEEIGRMAEYLTGKIRDGAAARMARRGLLEHYRLSRAEYAHTVYDLLGVVYDVEAPGAFNEDPRWHGFDRIGAMLATAPSHIDRYFKAADTVIELASLGGEPPSRVQRKIVGEGKRYLAQLGEGWNCFNVRRPGRYRVRMRLSSLPSFTGRAPRLALWHHEHKKPAWGMYLVAEESKPETIEFEMLFNQGGYKLLNYARTQKHPNGGIQRFRHEEIDASKPLASLKGGFKSNKTKVVDEQGRPVMPTLLIDWVELEGPLTTEALRANKKGLLPEKDDPGEVHASLKRFAERAWRRPVADAELEPYIQFIAAEKEAGESFQSACKSALSGMLVARSFFNIEEGSPRENRQQVNDFELASRLSYFLWSSMPDEELFTAARNGELHKPEQRAKAFDRMIADPKIDRFLNSFPHQWLQLHRVGMFQPDPKLYPEYGPWLEESMLLETKAYFAEMFRKNLPLREAVDSDWTMLNTRLAAHYGLPAPQALELTRVTLKPGSGRGGILTQASVLSLTSDGTRHRPVHRGAWLSEAILAHTPLPPPPNVDPLEPVEKDQPKTTIRSQLKAHATTPSCVSCHAKIDPLGLAFENFDAIGRWRETERVEGGVGDDPPVDASGVLPGGKAFAGPSEFKKLLAEDDARLAEAFLEQLATYALRRVMTVDDTEQLRSIVAKAKPDGYRLQSLVRGLVLSELFQKR
ncbi:MAG: DUF1592 domain-containing protein [Planctomycetota bacterium]|nr:DUF1592 domain-containing protein [Planctomycetota bacterium]